jgi:hypothetical protein
MANAGGNTFEDMLDGATSWQSQMYKSAFVNHDKTYNCSEQFFHCAKAHPS